MVEPLRQAHFRAYGTSFTIETTGDELLAAARSRAVALGWRQSSAEAGGVEYALRRVMATACGPPLYHLTCDGEIVGSTRDPDVLIEVFENHAKIQTAARSRGLLFVHAGVVAWRGRGILIPGRSRAGKSTLVHALLRAGAEYYSDEFALLDAEGRVHPYPVPLSLRANGSAPARRLPAESLGASTAQAPTFVDVILATQYRRRARWRPEPLSRGDALLILMDNTVAARQPPTRTMPTLRETVLRATAWRSWRGEAQPAARQILAAIA